MSQSPKRSIYSVTSLLVYESCPLQYHTTFVRGIPPPITPSMRRGTSVHSLISKHLRQRELVPETMTPEVRALLERFQQSRFNVSPVAVETSFVLPFERGDVRGRIDLVLPAQGNRLEVVDFKSGSARPAEEMRAHLQLPLYALAVSERFQRPAEELAYTYYFLRDDTEVSFSLDESGGQRVRGRVEGIITSIQEERFDPRPDCGCYASLWARRRVRKR
jgi:hypothetical protein